MHVHGLEPPAEREVVWAEGEKEEWLRPCERNSTTHTIDRLHEAAGWPEVIGAYRDKKITFEPDQVIMFTQAPGRGAARAHPPRLGTRPRPGRRRPADDAPARPGRP